MDDVAERMRQLGGRSPGTLADFTKAARLKEHPGQRPNARAMLTALLAAHERDRVRGRRGRGTCVREWSRLAAACRARARESPTGAALCPHALPPCEGRAAVETYAWVTE